METQIIAAIGALFFIWLSIVTLFVFRAITHYNRLINKSGKEDLQSLLEKLLKEQKINSERIDTVLKQIEEVEKAGIRHIQKVGIVRYNPFEDTGGDQSFVLAILDGENSGIILTSLHSRGVSRWYAKNIKEGRGVDHELSKEEEKVMKNAIKLKL